jgi:hypothetical protein
MLICACSSKQEESSGQEPVEEVVTIETSAAAPMEESSTQAVETKEVANTITQPVATKKSLYPTEVLNLVKRGIKN